MKSLMGHSLAKQNARVMYWGTLFASFNFLEPVMTLFYLARGMTAADVFWITLFWCLSVFLFEVPTGTFADRFGAKASFLTGCAIALLSKGLLLVAHDFWMFALCSALDGLAVTFFSGADEALIYESLKSEGAEDSMSEVWGKIESATYGPMILAYLFGAYFARDLSDVHFMILIGLSMLLRIGQLLLMFRVVNPKSAESFRDNPFLHVRNGFATIRKTPQLLLLFLNVTLVFIPTGVVFGKLEQPYLTQAGVPVGWLGVMYATAALLALVATRNLGRLANRFSRKRLMQVTGLLSFVGIATAALVLNSVLAASFAFFLIRLMRAIRYPIYSSISNEYIPSESRATTISLLSILDSACDLVLISAFATTAAFGMHVALIGAAIVVGLAQFLPLSEKSREERPDGSQNANAQEALQQG